MRRPALIFDFGNVVAHFDYRKAASKLGARLGLSGEDLLERLRPLGFSDLLKSYESGKISAEAFSKGVSEMIGLEITHDEFAAAWADIFTAQRVDRPLVRVLQAGGLYARARVEHQRPPREPVPPPVRRDLGAFRPARSLLRGRPHQALGVVLSRLRRGRRGRAGRLRVHRRPGRERRRSQGSPGWSGSSTSRPRACSATSKRSASRSRRGRIRPADGSILREVQGRALPSPTPIRRSPGKPCPTESESPCQNPASRTIGTRSPKNSACRFDNPQPGSTLEMIRMPLTSPAPGFARSTSRPPTSANSRSKT